MAGKRKNQDALDRAMVFFDEARKDHDEFVRGVERRYKVYRGLLEKKSKAAQWTSKAHPPYIMHIVETTLASLVDDKLKYRIKPRLSVQSLSDPSYAARAIEGAKAHQILFDNQIADDNFTEKQRPFLLQNAIAGLTVAKNYWVTKDERRRRLEPVSEPLLDEYDDPMLHPFTGEPLMHTRLEERDDFLTVYDGPTTEVRDIRDWLWTPNARDLETCPYIIDRAWKLPEEVWEGFEEGGPYGADRGGWDLKTCRRMLGTSRDFTEELVSREQEIWRIERTKGLVEVIEVWDNVRKTVTTIANRKVLLAHREGFPFFHNSYPFVICTTQPDLFRIPGISQVEKIEHLQTMLWDIANQSIDSMRLAANTIFAFRPDIEDPDAYEFAPGARWLVEDPSQVQQMKFDPVPAELSLGREALLKGDMQNLAGGFPFSSGADSQFVDQKTATGASIVSGLAQRSIDLSKQSVNSAWGRTGQQRLLLNQQFIREPVQATRTGLDGEDEIHLFPPEIFTGDFKFEAEPVADSIMKQEEQASSQALFQLGLTAFPMFAAAAQNGSATPINLDALWEDTLKAFGKEDTDRYFRSKAPAVLQGPSGPTPPTGPAPTGEEPQGITADGSVDPAVSPGSQISQAPVALLQRAQALSRGGASNV